MEGNVIFLGELIFFNFGMKCPEVSEEVKHGIPRDTRRSAGHPSDDFLGYPDDAL